jgi:flagellar P-ring protein precursor FlgI
MAPLLGSNGDLFAIAQGNLIVGGFSASGSDGSEVTVNNPSTGRIPNGATVEQSAPNAFASGDTVRLNLNSPDFTTANRLASLINSELGAGTANAIDAVSIDVRAPLDTNQRTSFISLLQSLEVEPGSPPARVIVNSRTGTVVISANVRVTAAAVSHGSLVVTISEKIGVSQPFAPFSDSGQTVVVPDSEVSVDQGDGKMFLFEAGISLDDIVQAVNRVGAAPVDLIAILELLKQAGALRAELMVI